MTILTRDHAFRMLAWRLKEAGIANASLDARLLTQAVCNIGEIEMIREPGARLSDEEINRLGQFEMRRLAGEPVSRILGRREFWGLAFRVSPATLDPRADSETLIETALPFLTDVEAPAILDLGTGTGCLLIALLHELPNATGVAIDVSAEALEIARQNADDLGVASRATFRHGCWVEGLSGRFDLVISNPPYIPAADIDELDVEVRAHDPRLALDGGADGLDAYRDIAAALPHLLKPGGHAVIELGVGQDEEVSAIFRTQQLVVTNIVPDIGQVPRALVACLPR
ncbi:MAG: peptide chain release factor N(5)-glutamine methyltransferase [Parvibaculum sp.]